jgi:hypothetical protein
VKDLLNGNNVKHHCLSLLDPSPLIFEQFDGPLTCADRICEQCGEDHDFNPSFDEVKTSIDVIPDLLRPRKERNPQYISVTRRRTEGN